MCKWAESGPESGTFAAFKSGRCANWIVWTQSSRPDCAPFILRAHFGFGKFHRLMWSPLPSPINLSILCMRWVCVAADSAVASNGLPWTAAARLVKLLPCVAVCLLCHVANKLHLLRMHPELLLRSPRHIVCGIEHTALTAVHSICIDPQIQFTRRASER